MTPRPSQIRRLFLAEAIGAFALVFAGTGAIIVHETTGAVTHIGVSLVFGLIVTVMITAVGGISGAHMNPAVTVALIAARRVPASTLATHIPGQLAGAFAASLLLRLLFPNSDTLGATLPLGPPAQAFILEMVITAILMLVILAVSALGRRPLAPPALAIGGTVALAALFAGPITGASMNPARSLAPALVSGHVEHLWIYITAPLAGALLAVPFWAAVAAPSTQTPAHPAPNPPERR